MDEGLTTAPAIAGNTIYVTSTLANKTYALKLQTGDFMWSFQTGGNIYSSPAIVDGVAYFGSYDGNLYAVGQNMDANNESGIPNVVYYGVAIVVLVVIIVVAVVVLRKQR